MKKIPFAEIFRSTGFIAGSLVFIGILLSVTVGMQFLVIAGLGAFGPGFLRELGLLKDQDEFARMARYRAGYLASLFAGSLAIILIAIIKFGSIDLDREALALTLILSVIWLVSIFAAIKKFWGVQKAVFRILVTFGTFWLMFVVLSHIKEPLTILMEGLVVAPFFLLAWGSKRWPRIAGILIIGIAIYTFFLFRLFIVNPDKLVINEILANAMVFLLFQCPLLVAGTALLTQKPIDAQVIEEQGDSHV